jgi:hypothetical protein
MGPDGFVVLQVANGTALIQFMAVHTARHESALNGERTNHCLECTGGAERVPGGSLM